MSTLEWSRNFALKPLTEDTELLQPLLDLFKTSFEGDGEKAKSAIAAENGV